jgi:hypothetical protein
MMNTSSRNLGKTELHVEAGKRCQKIMVLLAISIYLLSGIQFYTDCKFKTCVLNLSSFDALAFSYADKIGSGDSQNNIGSAQEASTNNVPIKTDRPSLAMRNMRPMMQYPSHGQFAFSPFNGNVFALTKKVKELHANLLI